ASRRGLQRSRDHGATWNDVQKPLPDLPIGALAVSPGSPSTLIALVSGRVFTTADGGASWRMLPATPALAFDLAVAGSEARLHVATAKGVFGLMHSPSGPDYWAWEGLQEREVTRLAASSSDGSLYAETGRSAFDPPVRPLDATRWFGRADGRPEWTRFALGLED